MQEKNKATDILGKMENLVYYAIAILLVIVAFYMLGSAAVFLVTHVSSMSYHELVLSLLEELLLVMMLVEILHTVTISLSQHILIADPFLAVAVIALVRRMLVITVELEQTRRADPMFNALIMEVGVIAGAILLLTISIHLLRSKRECEARPPC